LKHLAIAGAGLAFLTGKAAPIAAIPENVNKLPGAKTFGAPAVAGIAALAVDKFLWPNKWLRAAGYIGVGLAVVAIGNQGKDFKWVGGPEQNQLRGPDNTRLADVEASGRRGDDDEESGGLDEDDEDMGDYDDEDDEDDDEE